MAYISFQYFLFGGTCFLSKHFVAYISFSIFCLEGLVSFFKKIDGKHFGFAKKDIIPLGSLHTSTLGILSGVYPGEKKGGNQEENGKGWLRPCILWQHILELETKLMAWF